jgi:O-antigen/teichoic acid export membrane protein
MTTNGVRTPPSFVAAALSSSAAQVVAVVLAAIASVFQARYLGPAGRGELALWIGVGSLLTLLLGLGLASGITFQVARGASLAALGSRLALALVGTTLVAGLALGLVATSGLDGLLPDTLSTTVVVGSLVLYFALSQGSSWLAAVLIGRNSFTWVNLSAVVVGAIVLVGSIILLAHGQIGSDLDRLVGLLVGGEAVRAGMLAIALLAEASAEGSARTGTGQITFRGLMGFAGLSYLIDLVHFLVYRVDIWLVQLWHGSGELGRYAVAVSLAQLIWVAPTAAARVVFPVTATVGPKIALATTQKAARWTLVTSLMLGVIITIGVALGVDFVFGSGFESVPVLVAVLVVGAVPYAAAKIFGGYVAGAGALKPNLRAAVLTLGMTLVMDVALIPALGGFGAAIASALSYLIYTALVYRIARNVATASD